ncbi:MAG: hypothetical protein HC919_14880, partial [Oscillatoriales cyanobacterium SM2_2_1]|nr:hypothetical protein [Oscillatoriales cyanobacterium SM2_2_1]
MEPAPTEPKAALESDQHWMARCLELAQRGRTAPNPRVGCVIVKTNGVVGEGWHERAGAP